MVKRSLFLGCIVTLCMPLFGMQNSDHTEVQPFYAIHRPHYYSSDLSRRPEPERDLRIFAPGSLERIARYMYGDYFNNDDNNFNEDTTNINTPRSSINT